MFSRRPAYHPTEADLLRARATDAAQLLDVSRIAAAVRVDTNPQVLSEAGTMVAQTGVLEELGGGVEVVLTDVNRRRVSLT